MSATPTIPVDVVNEALDEIGIAAIGALTDGTPAANAAARIYWRTLRGVLSAAPWNFARMEIPLTLLGSNGAPNTSPINPNPPQVFGNPPPQPWIYMYDWPVDCVHLRYVPSVGTIQQTPTGQPIIPPNTPTANAWWGPAPFLVHSYPLPNASGWDDIEGHDPDSTKVILTNVCNAHAVYTAMKQYPDAWDALFQKAFSLTLAAQLCMPCIKDRKEAMAVRRDTRALAVEALNEARVRDGNEGWTVIDHTPDWIRNRAGYTGWGRNGWPVGGGWNPLPWAEDAGGVY